MAQNVFGRIHRAFTSNGTPEPGARVEFFRAGTTEPLQVYHDRELKQTAGVFVEANAHGVFPERWLPDEIIYKMIYRTAEGALIDTRDYVNKPVEPSTIEPSPVSFAELHERFDRLEGMIADLNQPAPEPEVREVEREVIRPDPETEAENERLRERCAELEKERDEERARREEVENRREPIKFEMEAEAPGYDVLRDVDEIPADMEDLAEPGEDWATLRARLIAELNQLRQYMFLGAINQVPGGKDRLDLLEHKNAEHKWMDD